MAGRQQRREARRKLRDYRVKCGTHGIAPGFVICGHVRTKNVPIVLVREPTQQLPLGEILCGECIEGVKREDDEARLVCRQCARGRGWLTPTSPALA